MSLYNVLTPDAAYGTDPYIGNRLMAMDSAIYQSSDLASAGVNLDPKAAASKLAPAIDSGTFGNIARQEYANVHNDVRNDDETFQNSLALSHYFKISASAKGVNWFGLTCQAYKNTSDPNRDEYKDACIDTTGMLPRNGTVATPAQLATYNAALDKKNTALSYYMVTLLLSLIMVLITTYVFMVMLNYLPFIGQGMIDLNMPVFGQGSLGMPGSKLGSSLPKSVGGGQ